MKQNNVFGKAIFSVSLKTPQTAKTMRLSSNAAYISLGEISFSIPLMRHQIVT